MRKLFSYLFFILSSYGAFSQEKILSISPSYRLYPSSVNQTEVFITKSPVDENILFASCNTLSFIPFFVSEGIYVTTDGGQSWRGSDTCTGNPIAFHGGDPGIVIDRNGLFILTRIGRSPFVGLYSHFSTDNGLTWSDQEVISTDDLERATITTDANPASPWYGRTYAAWVRFAPPYPLMISYTDDGAQSWTEPVPINNPPNRCAGGDIAVGPGGEVCVCWAGVTEVSPFREIYCGFAVSFDGGLSWSVTENAFPMNGITGILPEKGNIRVNGLPNIAVDLSASPARGRIYIVTGEKDMAPAGIDPDIIMHYSDDSGQSWSTGFRVNRDDLSNGKIQFFPGVDVDTTGALNVIFYDDRQTTSDSVDVFLSRTRDGGQTWAEYRISDHRFRPSPIGGLGQGYQGDNIDIVSTSTKLWPVWMDNSTGVYQVWTAPVDLAGLIGMPEPQRRGTESLSLRVHPNPVTETAVVEYTITKSGFISLVLYDISGKVISVFYRGWQSEGTHQMKFNPLSLIRNNNVSPGNYVQPFILMLRSGSAHEEASVKIFTSSGNSLSP
jgi:hypothetical protein